MARVDADRNLLLGILAQQMDFVTRDALFQAMNAWIIRKGTPLGALLVERGDLAPARRDLLEALVDEHVRAHGGVPARSLHALSSAGPVALDLGHLPDSDLRASLGHLPVPETIIPAETRAPDSLGAPTSWNGRFRVVRPHASGGLGVVSVALDEELDREVAFKEIKERYADDAGSRARFVLEAEITGKLEHPGVIPVHGLGHDPMGRPFYAMRFIRGDSLAEAVDRYHDPNGPYVDPAKRSMQLRELLGRFLDVCDAIAYAHSRGVLHRDLKPGNVMLGPFGETLVVDWGLALVLGQIPEGHESTHGAVKPSKAESASLTREHGRVVGTPAYMPPEQAEGYLDRLGPRSDVYGLGAILYELLTGKRPVEGDSLERILHGVRHGEIRPPRQFRPEVPAPLEAICLKALALRPEDRYATPRALGADLKAWLADEPVSARPEPLAERARRWAKRNRTMVTAAAASMLVGQVGLGAVAAVQTKARGDLDRKNVDLIATNAALDEQRRRAEDREAQAIAAVKKFGDAIANEPELKQNPALDALRKRLMQEPLNFIRALRDRLQADRDTRPKSLARLAQVSFDLGYLTDEIGDKRDALIAFGESLAIRRRLVEANPSAIDRQRDLATSHRHIGTLLGETGRPDEALREYEAALAIQAKLVESNPAAIDFQRELAGSHENLGELLGAIGRQDDARKSFEAALAVRRKLAEADPSAADIQHELASSHNSIGNLFRETSRPAEALKSFESTLAIRRKLAEANPSVAESQGNLASSHNDLGNLLSQIGRTDEALKQCESASEILAKLAEANPSVTIYRRHLAANHHNRGVLLNALGRPAEALDLHQSALAIQARLAEANPSVTDFGRELALSHVAVGDLLRVTGRTDEALKQYESALAIQARLAEANPSVTEYQSDLATVQHNVGLLLESIGRTDEALKSHESALGIWKKLAEANPSIAQYQSDLALGHQTIGKLLRATGRTSEARKEYEVALTIREALAEAHPSVTDFQSELAQGHHDLGLLRKATGQMDEALRQYEAALAIRRKLAEANPSITQFQRALADSHNSIGNLFREIDRPSEALESHESALAIRRKLAEANPSVIRFQSELATSHNNLGVLQGATGHPSEALESHESALAIRRKLAEANPSIAQYQRTLASSHDNLGHLLLEAGRPLEALGSFESALAIRRKLAEANPSVTALQAELADSHGSLGNARRETGHPSQARESYESARAIFQPLARDHPESPDYAAGLGSILHNLGVIDLDQGRVPEARARFREAIESHRKVLATNPANPDYRKSLDNALNSATQAARKLGDPRGVAEAERELAEFHDTDPAHVALNARLASVLRGEERPRDDAERLQLAWRAYEKSLHVAAARLYAEAFDADPKLAEDRKAQAPYNAACAAAMAGCGRGKDDPPPDDSARAKLRDRARTWLRAELTAWTKFLDSGSTDARATIPPTLDHWKEDHDLAGVREPKSLEALPEAERQPWQALWADVDALLARARETPAPSAK